MTKRIIVTIFAAAFLAGCASHAPYTRLDQSLQGDVVTFSGYQYLPLAKLCDAYGFSCAWDTFARTATVRKSSNAIVLRDGSERMLVNGAERKLDRPVMTSGGVVYVPVSFARKDLAPMAGATAVIPVQEAPEVTVPKKYAITTIVLDTGHGGKDVGALGRQERTKEKDLALSLSRKVRQILESNGIRVIMTRADDAFIPLQRRSDIANAGNADLFVSIHINASRSHLMRGFECYYLSNATDDNARALEAFEDSSLKLSDSAGAERSKALDKTLWDMTLTENRMESGELANFICASVEESMLIKNRGVRTARFYVLKHTNIPSVLVEAGYISNRYEEMKLRDPKFLDRMAEAIARGILRYKGRFEKTEGFTDV